MYKENSGEGYVKNEKQLLPLVKKKIIYLAALGLSFGTQVFIRSSLQHVESSSLTRDGTWAPCAASAVLAAGAPGKGPLITLTGDWRAGQMRDRK